MSRGGLNKAMLIGRIQPNDPELRYTQAGQAVCSFRFVTDEDYKDKDGNVVERSEWHHIVAWGKIGEIISQYAKKGSKLYLEGRIQTRKYEDKEGVTRYSTEINANEFRFLDSGGGGRSSDSENSRAGSSEPAFANAGSNAKQDDDLPF